MHYTIIMTLLSFRGKEEFLYILNDYFDIMIIMPMKLPTMTIKFPIIPKCFEYYNHKTI